MDFSEAAGKRRTVRDFSRREVPEAVIEKAAGLAFKAPSYNHLRQWDFILVRDGETKLRLTQTEEMLDAVTPEIASAFKNHDETAKAMYLEAIPKQRRMILGAPVVLAVVFRPKTPVREAERVYDLNCLASVWCCIENLLLSLAEDDVFGVTFIPKNTPGVKEALGIPAELEVAALIPIGYRGDGYREMPQKEIDIHSRIHRERW